MQIKWYKNRIIAGFYNLIYICRLFKKIDKNNNKGIYS